MDEVDESGDSLSEHEQTDICLKGLCSDEGKKTKKPRSKADYVVARNQKIRHFFSYFFSHGNKFVKLSKKERKHKQSEVVIPEPGDAVQTGNETIYSSAELIDYCDAILFPDDFDQDSFSKFAASEFVVKVSKEVFADRTFYKYICDEDDLERLFPTHFQEGTGERIASQLNSSDLFNAIEKYKFDCRIRGSIDVELRLSKFVRGSLSSNEQDALLKTKLRPLNIYLNDLFQYLSGRCWNATLPKEEEDKGHEEGNATLPTNVEKVEGNANGEDKEKVLRVCPQLFWESLLPQHIQDIRAHKETVSFPLKSSALKKYSNQNTVGKGSQFTE